MKLSIIIPVYHEEKNIKKTLQKIEKMVKTSHKTYIIYDDKKDPTYSVVKQYISTHKKSGILLTGNQFGNHRGVMNAIKTGFSKAKGDAIVVLMADLSDDVSQIDEMVTLYKQGYDVVCASRYMKGGKKIGGPFLKTFLSRIAGLSLYYLFHVATHDSTNAFKLYNRDMFKHITIQSTGGFEYSLEIILKAQKMGYSITEIPTIWRDRLDGASNFKILSWLPSYIKWYMQAFPLFAKFTKASTR